MRTDKLMDVTLGQLLDQAVSTHPDNDAVIYVDRAFRLSYREFGDLVDRLARGLMALGIQKGEKVAVWATNVPYWVALQFATAKIGAVLLTVNTNYKSSELTYLLKQSETENLFIIDGFRDTDYVQTVYELVPELKLQERGFLTSPKFPSLKRVCFLGQEKHRGMYTIPEILALAVMTTDAAYQERRRTLNPHDVVNMQYTSGTTGFPKGVMLTHHNIVNNGFWVGENQRFTPADRICIPVPLFHCFGCVMGVLGAVSHAATMVFLESFDPVDVMASVEEERCTALYGVPTMFMAVLHHKLFDKFDFSTLRTGIMAGSPCPIEIMKQVIDRLNMHEITICYGLTETSPVITQTRAEDDIRLRVESVGRALPGIEVRIVDPETHAPLPVGTQGEVCCRGYNVMKGYYNMSEATAQAVDTDGWLHSGDLGVMDENGYLSITGRHKDMIIRGGENIYPREIEEFLFQMEGIADVQVAGVPSPKYGEEIGAFIKIKEGHVMAPEDVRDFCRGRISHYKIPRYVAFVDDYPMTASGKIQKYKLRDLSVTLFPDRR
ncbi:MULTISPECIES: AMP-binding protein [Desulfococcus]|jgi:fatty-acyl-CoA synthase|uniref:AMP-dependent synthetase and ligase n=1 Tax=Desulfococcus multivorans DSM 2059 TaxID=1121405 RepID=S7VFQ3_DESML|nr:AMP-binding protein [Desulfococcus multivorans]AOY58497.1 LcfA2: long-chain-fatty-acid--CoA ligase [Desulfococcus multivorans]AQV00811.1 AMP-binding protein [Desulfococcus multivorans]EPR43283.1 AMP-dependent synthetase and ligase [Desulfococcus multivorans DSM 2059]MDX9817330.1 AMP-binding protein [Desulfococcus multivorans]SJZ42021.1 fatty-acyl-CoA synthase [Desulfococcus multivorans DSM 2059]